MALPAEAVTDPLPVIVVGLAASVTPCVMDVEMMSDMIPPGWPTTGS
jgi:hypothetical protein